MINGADASITNSNSNFGTFSRAEGLKEAFTKDDKGFITSIITPRSVVTSDQKIEYLQLRNEAGQSSPTKLFFLKNQRQFHRLILHKDLELVQKLVKKYL